MNHINIKNIDEQDKEKISNDSFFIVLSSKDKIGKNILTEQIIDNIYRPKLLSIFKILQNVGIDFNNFSLLGDTQINNTDIVSIVLANKKITSNPLDYINIGKLGDYTIWKSIPGKEYSALGNILSIGKPSYFATSVINNKFLVNYNGNTKYTFDIFTNNITPEYMIDIYGNPLLWGNIIYGKNVTLDKALNPWFKNKIIPELNTNNTNNVNVNESFYAKDKVFTKLNIVYFTLLIIVVVMMLKQWYN